MDLGLAGKSVLITGAAKGIGNATAHVFAAEGCNLVLVDIDGAGLEQAKAKIAGSAAVRVDTVAADLTRSESIALLAGKFPDIDILVNNAGAIPGGSLQDVDEAAWRAAWDLKVFGYINLCRAFYPLLKRHGGGVIVNVVGTAAQSRDPGYICGVAGNAALSAFSQSLGSESHKDNIRVVAIAPGPISTDRLVTLLKKRAADKLGDAGKWQEFFAGFPFGRAGEPVEVAAAIVFNASRYSAYTSGSIVTVDGGRSARSN